MEVRLGTSTRMYISAEARAALPFFGKAQCKGNIPMYLLTSVSFLLMDLFPLYHLLCGREPIRLLFLHGGLNDRGRW